MTSAKLIKRYSSMDELAIIDQGFFFKKYFIGYHQYTPESLTRYKDRRRSRWQNWGCHTSGSTRSSNRGETTKHGKNGTNMLSLRDGFLPPQNERMGVNNGHLGPCPPHSTAISLQKYDVFYSHIPLWHTVTSCSHRMFEFCNCCMFFMTINVKNWLCLSEEKQKRNTQEKGN